MVFYKFSAERITGESQKLEEFRGRVLLVVNTASRCGLTPQFEGLESLFQQYQDKGLTVLGFPCNQFLKQDPGSNDKIASFCQKNYGVSFPMFAKIKVNGSDTHPLYKFLKKEAKGMLGTKRISWNFTKFLIDREGNVLKRYTPKTSPSQIASDIENLL